MQIVDSIELSVRILKAIQEKIIIGTENIQKPNIQQTAVYFLKSPPD